MHRGRRKSNRATRTDTLQRGIAMKLYTMCVEFKCVFDLHNFLSMCHESWIRNIANVNSNDFPNLERLYFEV